MTIKQWYSLDEMEQIETIWNKAKKIAERKDNTYTYILYQIDNFYVEEQIHTEWKVRRALNACTEFQLPLLAYNS